MEVDERPTEQYTDIGGLDKQIQEVCMCMWIREERGERREERGERREASGVQEKMRPREGGKKSEKKTMGERAAIGVEMVV